MEIRKRFKAFEEWRALAVWLVLIGLILCFFDYLFYVMEKSRGVEYANMETSTEQELDGFRDICRDDSEDLISGSSGYTTADGPIEIVADETLTTFEVWNGGVKAGNIQKGNPSQIEIFKRTHSSAYLGISSVGLDGDILSKGPKEIYKLNLKNNCLFLLLGSDGWITDISPDEKNLAAVENFYLGEKLKTYVFVHSLENGQEKSFEVPSPYAIVRTAVFSPDGKSIVYKAATNNQDDKEFADFMIDLDRGEQRQF